MDISGIYFERKIDFSKKIIWNNTAVNWDQYKSCRNEYFRECKRIRDDYNNSQFAQLLHEGTAN